MYVGGRACVSVEGPRAKAEYCSRHRKIELRFGWWNEDIAGILTVNCGPTALVMCFCSDWESLSMGPHPHLPSQRAGGDPRQALPDGCAHLA